MNEIQIFKHEKFREIRTLEIDGQIYFVGTDVAKALGDSKPGNALTQHVDEEDKMLFNLNTALKQGSIRRRGNPNVIIVNESGLYALIMSSKLPDAKKFRHWVTSEVLPTIRKTGGYGNTSLTPQQFDEIKFMIKETVESILAEKSEEISDKTVVKLIDVLFPYFNSSEKNLDSLVKALNKSIVKSISDNLKLLSFYIDYLIKK
ncbi:MAG: hypothetical protein NC177_09725 [Ruminococcus flavefaciens]|nr:hypothetical protein [Ruminococcus flavefaciens]